MLSIVIPTYNEGDNVTRIASRIREVLRDKPYEIVFIDDSIDNTPELLSSLALQDPHVVYRHRVGQRGLATAVLKGFEVAEGEIIAVMDADLQHPPEILMPMWRAIEQGADIAIPSRFIPGGNDGGLSLKRKIVSATARYMGKASLRRLRNVADVTSGYFMFRRGVIEGVNLQPIGWKILIEILVRGSYTRVVEIPYGFKTRSLGYSKLSVKEQWNYVRHLISLVKDSPEDRRFYCFALVGLSGVFVNMFVYYSLTLLGLEVRTAGTTSALAAMTTNFILNDRITWSNARRGSIWQRSFRFFLVSSLGIILNVEVLSFLYYHHRINHLLANFFGILTAVLWNFTMNNIWTWPSKVNSISVERWPQELVIQYLVADNE